ncbi:amidohydrolase family protein [Acuticoccus kandeliae]|uniref:amidohydrolase family protein n=1 Tax=Acuticoccus kandeliae TaxID=2073160 RepID=UPI000D3ED6D6|nr:amidohydrolase family protein [Acuticoccus kandeliae]
MTMSPTIDIHAHLVAPALIEELARNPAAYGVRTEPGADGHPRLGFLDRPLYPRPLFPALTDLTLRLPQMEADGIALQLISTWTDIAGDDLPVREGVRWARLQNDTLIEAASEYPGLFEAMGTLPMQHAPSAIAELERLASVGVRSVQIGTHANGVELDHESLDPLWRRIADLGIFVMLHPPAHPVGSDRTGDYFLNNLIGFTTDTTIAGARLIFGGVMSRYPSLKVCLVHGGGFLPYQIGRMDRGFEAHPACSAKLHRKPSDLLRAFYFDTITHDAAALDYLIGRVGADRLVYGTDTPFEMLDAHGLERIAASAVLSESDRQAIRAGNAEAALGIAADALQS